MTEAILLSAGTIGPLALCAKMIFSKSHQYERWAKIALVMLAFDAVAWCVSRVLQSSIGHWHLAIIRIHSIFAGAGLSLMLLLLLSGQLNNPRRKTSGESEK